MNFYRDKKTIVGECQLPLYREADINVVRMENAGKIVSQVMAKNQSINKPRKIGGTYFYIQENEDNSD